MIFLSGASSVFATRNGGTEQDVLINLSLSVDLRKAGTSDRLEDSLDYRTVNKQILGMAENSRYYLVEALAQAVADICLEYPPVIEATVQGREAVRASVRQERGSGNHADKTG